MKTKEQITEELKGFYGTEAYHELEPGIMLTDGAKFVFVETGTIAVAQAIAKLQPTLKKSRSLRQAQFWTFKRVDGPKFKLTCTNGSDAKHIAVDQDYDNIACPLDMFEIYVMPNGSDQVMLLPSEY